MRLPFAIIQALALAVALHPAMCSAQSIEGEWVNYLHSEFWSSADKRCVLRLFEERRYIIDARNGAREWSGVYASILHGRWVKQQSSACSHPVLGSKEAYMRIRAWEISLLSTPASTYRVSADWKECQGDGCDQKDMFQGHFDSTLQFMGSELIESDDSTLRNNVLKFHPVAEAQKRNNNDAQAFLSVWESMVSAKSLKEFIDLHCDLRGFPSTDENVRLIEKYRSVALGDTHDRFTVLEAYRLEAPSASVGGEPILFLQVINERTDGRRSREMFELSYLNGRWKVLGFRF